MSVAPGARGTRVRPHPAGRGAARLVPLLVAVACLVGTAPAASAAAQHEDGLVVAMTGIDPAFLAPGQSLTVAGTVTNGPTSEVTGTSLSLRLQRNPPSTRFAMDAWLDPAATYSTVLLARQTIGSLASGASAPFSFTVPADDLPLQATPSSWGPRGLLVDAAADGSGRLTDADRTLLVWLPALTAEPTRLSILIPLVASPADLLGAALAGTHVAEQSGQRIVSLAQATAGRAAVAWALDPALLGAASATEPGSEAPPTGSPTDDPASETPTPSPQDPAPSADDDDADDDAGAELATTLAELGQGREIVALPYADADVAALTHTGRGALLDAAAAAGGDLLAAGGVNPLEGFGWPAAAEPDAVTVRMLAAKGARALVLPEAALPLAQQLSYTPTGRGTVRTDGEGDDGVAALLAEEALSAALTGNAPRSEDEADDAAALGARQYVLALTAAVTRERPADVQHLLAVVPRGFDGDAGALGERLAVLADAPWVELAPLSTMLAAAVPGNRRSTLPEEIVQEAEVTTGLLDEVGRARTGLGAFATIAQDPEQLVEDEQLRLLQVQSAAWRADPGGRSSFANAVLSAAAQMPTRVGVVASGTVNLISETGGLPVTVRNELDQPITARLRLVPREPSILLPDLVPVEVPAGSEVAFPVTVNAVGSADVEVDAELVDNNGQRVGQAVTLFVRVRADWENVGTALFAAAVAITFVLGLIRSIRRAHRRRSAVPEGSAG